MNFISEKMEIENVVVECIYKYKTKNRGGDRVNTSNSNNENISKIVTISFIYFFLLYLLLSTPKKGTSSFTSLPRNAEPEH